MRGVLILLLWAGAPGVKAQDVVKPSVDPASVVEAPDALAAPDPAGALEVNEAAEDGSNFLISVTAHSSDLEGKSMVLQVLADGRDAYSVSVNDDGSGHDHTAGDGRYSAEVSAYSSGPVTLLLTDGNGMEIWRTEGFEVPRSMEYPALRLKFFGGEVSGGLVEDVPVTSLEPGDLESLEMVGPEPTQTSRELVWLVLAGFVGGVFSFLLVGLRRGIGGVDQRLAPGIRPDSGALPRLNPGVQVWRLGASSAGKELIEEVSRREALHRPLLVVPLPGSRASLGTDLKEVAGVAFPREDRPDVDDLVQWCAGLLAPLDGLLLVEGVGALEAPGPGETELEILEDLVGRIFVDCLVLVGPEDLSPLDPVHQLSSAG